MRAIRVGVPGSPCGPIPLHAGALDRTTTNWGSSLAGNVAPVPPSVPPGDPPSVPPGVPASVSPGVPPSVDPPPSTTGGLPASVPGDVPASVPGDVPASVPGDVPASAEGEVLLELAGGDPPEQRPNARLASTHSKARRTCTPARSCPLPGRGTRGERSPPGTGQPSRFRVTRFS